MAFPYPISGLITASDSTNPSGVRVVVRNDRTIETINVTTDSNGEYVANLMNFTSGYQTGDSVTVICSYGLDYGETTFTVSGSTYTADVDMEETVESAEVDYCTISEVWDELDDKTSSDISAKRVKEAIKRSEALIDLRTNTSYKLNTVTSEIYSANADSLYKSREVSLGGVVGGLQRADGMFNCGDTILLRNKPVVSITSLYKNEQGGSSADSWTLLSEQTGSGGDFILDKRLGSVTFVNKLPTSGIRRSVKVTYTWGIDRDNTTDANELRKIELVRELCVLLSVRQILTSKLSGVRFDDIDDIKLEAISTSAGTNGMVKYLEHIKVRIDELFNTLGELNDSLMYDG